MNSSMSNGESLFFDELFSSLWIGLGKLRFIRDCFNEVFLFCLSYCWNFLLTSYQFLAGALVSSSSSNSIPSFILSSWSIDFKNINPYQSLISNWKSSEMALKFMEWWCFFDATQLSNSYRLVLVNSCPQMLSTISFGRIPMICGPIEALQYVYPELRIPLNWSIEQLYCLTHTPWSIKLLYLCKHFEMVMPSNCPNVYTSLATIHEQCSSLLFVSLFCIIIFVIINAKSLFWVPNLPYHSFQIGFTKLCREVTIRLYYNIYKTRTLFEASIFWFSGFCGVLFSVDFGVFL